MQLTTQLAKNFRDLYYWGNWTSVNLKDVLADVSWTDAVRKLHGLNTIAALVYHSNYFVSAALKVLQGDPLNAKDMYSYDHAPIESREDWDSLLEKVWAEADAFLALVEKLPDEKLWEDFYQSKYGNYFRNLFGIIEHTHYHLGQIVLIKKLIRKEDEDKGRF
ncbi:MAG: DUF1572 domain-containing protein [Saprospiraceae bacterium]|nr:DUF1572 domain-containing protein [Saprospiraceae bacterium]